MFESHKHLEVVKVLESANLSVLENVSSDLIDCATKLSESNTKFSDHSQFVKSNSPCYVKGSFSTIT